MLPEGCHSCVTALERNLLRESRWLGRYVCRMEGSQHRGWTPGRYGCGKEEFPILGGWPQASLWASGLRDTLIETTGLTGTGISLEERSSVWFEPMGGKGDISSSCLKLTPSFLIIGNQGRKDLMLFLPPISPPWVALGGIRRKTKVTMILSKVEFPAPGWLGAHWTCFLPVRSFHSVNKTDLTVPGTLITGL